MPYIIFFHKIKNFIFLVLIPLLLGSLLGYLIFNNFSNNKKKLGTICIVIDDYGYIFDNMVEEFLKLHPNITSAIIPGSPYARKIGNYINNLNLESIIHMPMESHEIDNIKYSIELNGKLNSKIIEQRVQDAFHEIPYALGMNNHQGSKATEDLQLMKDLARVLKKEGKFFLDSFTSSESRAFITMRRYGVPTQLRQIFLDHVQDLEYIKQNLDSLVQLSHQMPIVVGIGHVKPLTLKILKEEIPKLEKQGYKFVRLSQVVQ